MAFKLRSGNGTTFKNMGTSPFKDMKTGKYEHSFESPAKQGLKKGGEAQDQDKIFNDKGEHVGDWVNDKKVMHYKPRSNEERAKLIKNMEKKNLETLRKSPAKHPTHEDHHGDKKFSKKELDKIMQLKKLHSKPDSSPAKQTDTTWADGSKKSKRQIAEQKMHPSEYWYKIDGKKATKAQYMKYKNVPGKMEGGGKQTNDPTVSLARQSADKRQKKQ